MGNRRNDNENDDEKAAWEGLWREERHGEGVRLGEGWPYSSLQRGKSGRRWAAAARRERAGSWEHMVSPHTSLHSCTLSLRSDEMFTGFPWKTMPGVLRRY